MFLSVREVMPTGDTDMGYSHLQDLFTVIPAEAGTREILRTNIQRQALLESG